MEGKGKGRPTAVRKDAWGKGCAEAVFVCDVIDDFAGVYEGVGCLERLEGTSDNFVLTWSSFCMVHLEFYA